MVSPTGSASAGCYSPIAVDTLVGTALASILLGQKDAATGAVALAAAFALFFAIRRGSGRTGGEPATR